jgi:predicted phage terminase large subunit-like protein
MVTIKPQAVQERFLRSLADICIFGGAAGGGKSWALLLEPLYHVAKTGFGAVIFRRTFPQITQQGGLWDQSMRLYPQLGATPNQSAMEWRFPTGARVRFAHLQHEKNIYDWQGSEIPLIGFDELTHFTEQQFWYLLSRNRSLCGIKPYVRAGCNPDADSWVAKLLAWWIDQDTGYAIPERAGKMRWFVRVNEQLEWADNPDELRQRYPEIPPKSLSFIPAKLSDNAALMKADPGYLANLLALPLVERERLLGGNWKIRPNAGLVFNRGWFQLVPVAPADAVRLWYWDKAGTTDGGNYSAGVLMSRARGSGIFYVENLVRGQWSSLQRNNVMLQCAQNTGPAVAVWSEMEPGSGGKESGETTIRLFAGYNVHVEPVTGDKLTRARPLSAQAEAGNVKIVAGPWNEAYLHEMHAFPDGAYDDQVDASSGAFNKLTLAHWDMSFSVDEGGSVLDRYPFGAGVFGDLGVSGSSFLNNPFEEDRRKRL